MKTINIKKHFLTFIVGVVSILFMTSHLTAGELFADIDHDSRLESVQWRKFATNDMGDYYQIQVIDDNGELMWRGPGKLRDDHPYIFSSLGIGVSLPELLFDIDRDGYVELLAAEHQSDVRATFFRKLRWTGRTFEVLPSQALMMRKPESDYFSWVSRERTHGIWVSKFRRVARRDLVKADVTYYDRNGLWKGGVALLRFTSGGAVVHRWIKPLAVPSKNKYRARLSYADHRNSRGMVLDSVADILQQDRANFYRRGGDTEDQSDPYFNSGTERSTIRLLRINPVGMSYDRWKSIILYGNPLIEVEVYSNQLNVRILQK